MRLSIAQRATLLPLSLPLTTKLYLMQCLLCSRVSAANKTSNRLGVCKDVSVKYFICHIPNRFVLFKYFNAYKTK